MGHSANRNVSERANPYTWSDDKARQYNEPQRTDFGDYIRAKGFKLT